MTAAGRPDGGPERAAVVRPASLEELARLVREARRVLPRGGGTKVRSWEAAPARPAGGGRDAANPWAADDVLVLDTTGLAGVVEYDPAEFTVTVRAGTPVAALEALLAEHGQYLPFDPLLVDAGATVGGTVAMGVSGACRLRYGGVRDFVLGVTCVDGEGRVVRAGGRVVKNAAGYDLPKFLCGSMGRFAVLAELTLKVFPRPEEFLTVVLACPDVAEAATALRALYRSPLEPHALEVAAPGVLDGLLPAEVAPAAPAEPAGSAYLLLVRIGGPAAILRGWADRVIERVREATGRPPAAEVLAGAAERRLWTALRELAWAGRRDAGRADGGPLLRLYSRPALMPELDALLDRHGARRLHSQAATAAWVLFPDEPAWEALLPALRAAAVPALLWAGSGPWPGGYLVPPAGTAVAQALKRVFDPHGRLPPLPWEEGV